MKRRKNVVECISFAVIK